MHPYAIFLYSLVGSLAFTGVKGTSTVDFTAGFDEGGAVPVSTIANDPPVGVSKGLNYTTFRKTTPGVAGQPVVGFKPQSPPNVAIAGTATELPSISTQGTNTKSFRLDSMYIGLQAVLANTVVQVPVKGSVRVTGYSARTGQPVGPPVDLPFNPVSTELAQPLQFRSLPKSFTGLERVTVEPVPDGIPATAAAMLIDNVKGATTA